jgi:hypothetical protein
MKKGRKRKISFLHQHIHFSGDEKKKKKREKKYDTTIITLRKQTHTHTPHREYICAERQTIFPSSSSQM